MTCHKANVRLLNRPNGILFSDKVISTPSVHDDGRARGNVLTRARDDDVRSASDVAHVYVQELVNKTLLSPVYVKEIALT